MMIQASVHYTILASDRFFHNLSLNIKSKQLGNHLYSNIVVNFMPIGGIRNKINKYR